MVHLSSFSCLPPHIHIKHLLAPPPSLSGQDKPQKKGIHVRCSFKSELTHRTTNIHTYTTPMMALGSVQFSLATTVGGTGVVPAISAGASNQQRPPRLASADSACCTADQPPPHCRLSRSCSRPRGHLLTAGGNSNCGRSPRGGSTVAHCWQPAAAVGLTFVAVAAVGVAAVPSDYPECCKK